MAQNEIKDSKPIYIGSRVLNIFKYAFLILCCLVVIVPILVVLIGSLKTYKELSKHENIVAVKEARQRSLHRTFFLRSKTRL